MRLYFHSSAKWTRFGQFSRNVSVWHAVVLILQEKQNQKTTTALLSDDKLLKPRARHIQTSHFNRPRKHLHFPNRSSNLHLPLLLIAHLGHLEKRPRPVRPPLRHLHRLFRRITENHIAEHAEDRELRGRPGRNGGETALTPPSRGGGTQYVLQVQRGSRAERRGVRREPERNRANQQKRTEESETRSGTTAVVFVKVEEKGGWAGGAVGARCRIQAHQMRSKTVKLNTTDRIQLRRTSKSTLSPIGSNESK